MLKPFVHYWLKFSRLLLIIGLCIGLNGQAMADLPSALAGKTLVVGSESDYAPFSFGESPAKLQGFNVDLWQALALQSQLNYRFRVAPLPQLLEEFKQGQIDVLINCAQSEERHRYADFSVPVMVVKNAFFVRKGQSAIQAEADLTGKAIIVREGALTRDYVIAKGWQKHMVVVKSIQEGLKLLASGKYDALLAAKLPTLKLIAELKLASLEAIDIDTGEPMRLSFAVPEGKVELLAEINQGLSLLKTTGTYDKAFDKWFSVYQEQEFWFYLRHYAAPIALALVIFFAYFYYQWLALHKAAHQKIADYQRRTQLALEGADLGLWDWQVMTGKVFFNERWCTMLGYALTEIEPHVSSWKNLVHPEDWAVINRALQQHLAGKAPAYEQCR
jgi:polar amino acid transport system substrate-binding protein